MKRSLIICLLIILVGSLSANTKIDSLETLLNNVVSKEKPHILNQLNWKMEFNGSDGAHFKLEFKESNKKEKK